MNNWTRKDRVLAFVRLARRPVTLVEITDALGDDFSSVSATLSALYQEGELNRERILTEKGLRYAYTDPAYDELLCLRRAAGVGS